MRKFFLSGLVVTLAWTCFADDLSKNIISEADSVYADSIVITEINYNSAADFDTEDWVELYNNSASAIDISGWKFSDDDDDNVFIFPQDVFIEAGDFLVLIRDSVDFNLFFPAITNYIGEFDFNISNGGELIRLFDNLGYLLDSLTFDDEDPWPLEPDGNGPTLVLIEPDLPNHLVENWRASTAPHGSPGQSNGWVGVNDTPNYSPAEFSLHSPYPNPFNNSCVLSFEIPLRASVTLTVYNSQGQAAAILIDNYLNHGYHDISFDAANLTSGIYFARLSCENYNQTQKIVLMK